MKPSILLLSGLILLVLVAQPLQFSAAASQASDDLVFDFVANAPNAQWRSGLGPLPFPGTSGDYRGYAQTVANPVLEDGSISATPGLLTVPQYKYDGYLQGVYPEYTVQKNDHFQALVNCEYGVTKCYVTFRLDYLTPGGATKIVGQWKEKHDNHYYAVDLDLSPLAGQKVRFMLTMLATGFADSDRAVWVAPRIVRPGDGLTPLPTLTATSTPYLTPPPVTPSNCNKAAFVTDITVRDGTAFTPGATFTKAWRLQNAGSCTWSKSYSLVFFSGEQMGAPTAVNLPWEVAPGQSVDLAINAVAPSNFGPHLGYWMLRNASGALFGIGSGGVDPLRIQIVVTGNPPDSANGFDFVANACSAQWRSGAGNLPCPGIDGDSKGFMLNLAAPRLEDGTISSSPGLLTMPQNKYDGYLQGVYPTFTVQPGDRFRALVGCEYGASCYVTLRLDYLTPGGATKIVWKWSEKNEGHYYSVDLDLTALAGQSVRFMLTTLASGYASGDRALWVAPRIVRTMQATSTSTPTPTALPPDWLTYYNAKNSFQFRFPPGQIIQAQDDYAYINLPFVTGTNLVSKHVEVSASTDPSQCALADAQTIIINGLTFLKQISRDQAMGHVYDVYTYTTVQGSTCVKTMFVLRSGVPGNYVPTAVPFDLGAEAAVFEQILATFTWLATPSPTPYIMCTPPICAAPNVLACGDPNGCPGGCGTICTAPSPTPSPTSAFSGPYAVLPLPWINPLTAYSAPGAGNPVVAAFPLETKDLQRSPALVTLGAEKWAEIRHVTLTSGWVLDTHLTEYLAPESFVTDPRPIALIASLKQALNNSDSSLFASLVSPKHGLRITYHGNGGETITYASPAALQGIFSDPTIYSWGAEGASGNVVTGTFAEVVRPKLLDVLNASYELHPNDPQNARMYPSPWPVGLQNLNFFSVFRPASEPALFNWREWLVGFEYVDGQPYIVAMLQFVWEP